MREIEIADKLTPNIIYVLVKIALTAVLSAGHAQTRTGQSA